MKVKKPNRNTVTLLYNMSIGLFPLVLPYGLLVMFPHKKSFVVKNKQYDY